MRHWIDMHCDTLSELLVTEPGETVEKNHLCVDVERMRQTSMLAEFFACFVEIPDGEWDAGYQKVQQMIARMEAEQVQIRKFRLLKSIRSLPPIRMPGLFVRIQEIFRMKCCMHLEKKEEWQDWIRGIGEMEQIWEAFHRAGMTQRQLDKMQYQNVERVLREIL